MDNLKEKSAFTADDAGVKAYAEYLASLKEVHRLISISTSAISASHRYQRELLDLNRAVAGCIQITGVPDATATGR